MGSGSSLRESDGRFGFLLGETKLRKVVNKDMMTGVIQRLSSMDGLSFMIKSIDREGTPGSNLLKEAFDVRYSGDC